MELTMPVTYRNEYLTALSNEGNKEDVVKKLAAKDFFEPIMNISYLAPEQAPVYKDEARQLQELLLDMTAVNAGAVEMKDYIDSVRENLDITLKSVTDIIEAEESRLRDIGMLCGTDNDYSMVVPVTADMFGTDSDYDKLSPYVFGCKAESMNSVSYEIVNIDGNGYKGNLIKDYCIKGIDHTDPNDSFEYITDENDITAFEYSRLYCRDRKDAVDRTVNYDSKDLEMTIILHSQEDVCKMKLLSEIEGLKINKISISNDGLSFVDISGKTVELDNPEAVYDDTNYIFGSGYICFPYASYIKISLSTDRFTDDIIDKESVDLIRRKCIKINNIKLYSGEFTATDITSTEILTSSSVDKVGLFLSEYVPDHFAGSNYFSYFLIVNGTEYEITPMNLSGTSNRFIRYAENADIVTDKDTIVISESIKSLKVRVKITPEGKKETPYVGNIKLCLGKDIGAIYVTE